MLPTWPPMMPPRPRLDPATGGGEWLRLQCGQSHFCATQQLFFNLLSELRLRSEQVEDFFWILACIFNLYPSANFATLLSGHWTKWCLGHVWCLGRSWTSTVSTGGWEWFRIDWWRICVCDSLLICWSFGASEQLLHRFFSGGCWPQLFHCLAWLKKGCDVGYTDFHLHIKMHNKLESQIKSWWNQTPAVHSAPLPSTIFGGAMSEVLLKGLRIWGRDFSPKQIWKSWEFHKRLWERCFLQHLG